MLLHDQLDDWARQRPDGEFAVHGARSLSWQQAREQADRTANALVGLGLPTGARMAVLAKNSLDYLVLYYAASKAGVVPVPLNYRSAPPEWRQVITDSTATLVVADGGYLPQLDAVRGGLDGVRTFATLDGETAPGWQSLPALAARCPATAPARRVDPDDDVYQLYTSGTTGRQKGAVLTHGAVTANCAQIAAMPHRGAPGERSLVVAPLCHAAAVWAAFAPQSWGASLYLQTDFDPVAVLSALRTERIGYAALVPSMIQMCLVAVPDTGRRRYPGLRMIATGSAPIAESTLRRAVEEFGCDVVVGYGLTEASAATSAMTPGDLRAGLSGRSDLLHCVGRPLPGTEVRIVDPAGAVLPVGEVGEIAVRGPQLMRGYWRASAATEEVMHEGWLHTGDAGRLDSEGYLHIVDRIKDVIISGGLNVYPRMVEDVLHAHPGVAETAVIGVPNERWGEAVKAVVVPRPGAALDEDELLEFCRGRLGDHQRPRSVDLVTELPRTTSGKVRKRALREPYWAGRDMLVGGA